MKGYKRLFRDRIADVILNRVADVRRPLYYLEGLTLVVKKFPLVEVGIAIPVLDQLLDEGVLWL